MTGEAIKEAHHVVRYVPWSKLRKTILDDGTEVVEGPAFNAFSLRPEEEYLSASWREYYPGDEYTQMHETVRLNRLVRNVGTKSAFAIGVARDIRKTCEQRRHQVRMLHEPDGPNVSHAAIRRYPRDDFELQELLAVTSWSDFALNSTFPP